jgi:hypothetical protein
MRSVTERTDAKSRIAVIARWLLGILGEHAVTVSVTSDTPC